MTKIANCHPDRKHHAKGLCYLCYGKARYQLDREKSLATSREWYKRNKVHHNIASKKWYKANFDKVRDLELRSTYGISLTDYEQMLSDQAGSCKLCGAVPVNRPVVDHDHSNGKIRGIVCHLCNIGIGCFKDDPNLLRLAIAYLEADKSCLK